MVGVRTLFSHHIYAVDISYYLPFVGLRNVSLRLQSKPIHGILYVESL